MVGTLDGGAAAGLFSPLSIFLLVLALELLDGFIDHLKKRGARSSEQTQLRQEIRQLLKEASSLSMPSTFAQTAKLRRMAAAKEKELSRMQEEHKKETKASYDLYTKSLMAFKVLASAVISWWFWGIPVATVPQHLLQPFGRVLSWTAGDAASGQIMVGIIPWLVLTSRVSKFLSQKLWKKNPQK